MLLDISPLRRHRDFRLVFIGQLVSSFGAFVTYVALPVQVYALTESQPAAADAARRIRASDRSRPRIASAS
jgi:hypothetical protein